MGRFCPLVARAGNMREAPVREQIAHIRSAVAGHPAETAGKLDELAQVGHLLLPADWRPWVLIKKAVDVVAEPAALGLLRRGGGGGRRARGRRLVCRPLY